MILRRLSRRFLYLLLLSGLALSPLATFAASATDAASFINELVTQGLRSVDNKQLSEQDRSKRFFDLLDRDFDMPRIARFVLGRYWNEASDADKREFQRLFEEYVVRSYAQRFSEYNGETVKIMGTREENETRTLVQSQIVRPNGAPPASVNWRVRKGDDGFKIVDVDVEGVSMVLTQREEFASVIQRGGVAGLNKTLQEKLASGDTSLAAPILPKK
jgi:phospholipid transport system substrate-binding protein